VEQFGREQRACFEPLDGNPAYAEFEKKAARVNMRLPKPLLDAVKKRARRRGVPYQRFIREALERALATAK